MKRPSVGIIFLTVFIDLIGFGIVVPMVPVLSKHMGASGLMIGVIFAAFSAMQFFFAPIWGRLSDRIGRRPVLLFSTLGSVVAYGIFAFGSALESHTAGLWTILLSRVFAGICGGNITVAQAYIADITPPDERSRKMGLIGMAFGLGFIFGPIIGGLSLKYLGATGPGWVAAAMCAANFLLALGILPESLQPGSAHAAQRPHLAQWQHTLAQPKVGLLVVVFFLATFCFSCFETTLALLVSSNFHIDIDTNERSGSEVVLLFAYCGIIGALVQGGAIGKLVKRLGERKLIALSLVLTGLSLAPLPYISGTARLSWGVLVQPAGLPWLVLLAVLAVLSIGSALTRPPLFGLLSNLTPANEQGATIGVAQGAGSLARIFGPLFAGPLFTTHPAWPYLACAAISLGTGFLVLQRLGHSGRSSPAQAASTT
jgi:MFS transporter, DHA1 family, tetracycline resistance protein